MSEETENIIYDNAYVRYATIEEENNLTVYMNDYLKRYLEKLKRIYGAEHKNIIELEKKLQMLSVFDEKPK
jgi:hypothetical protein